MFLSQNNIWNESIKFNYSSFIERLTLNLLVDVLGQMLFNLQHSVFSVTVINCFSEYEKKEKKKGIRLFYVILVVGISKDVNTVDSDILAFRNKCVL